MLNRIRPEFEKRLREVLEEELGTFTPYVKKPLTKRPIPISGIIKIALMINGGKATSREITVVAKKFSVESKSVSSALSRMAKQGLIDRSSIPEGYLYIVNDWFKWLSALKAESKAFNFALQELKTDPAFRNNFVLNLFEWYVKTHRTVHIRNEFLRECTNVVGEELAHIIEEALPAILGELRAKRIVELTPGLDGVNIEGQPMALASYVGEA
ncbi:MAG: hypothetical protein ACUVTD_04285 [Nitrososphaerales archaeon]